MSGMCAKWYPELKKKIVKSWPCKKNVFYKDCLAALKVRIKLENQRV